MRFLFFSCFFSNASVCGGSCTSRAGARLLSGTFPHQPSLPTLCFLCWLRVGFHLFCNGFLLWRPRLAVPPVALLAAAMSYSMSSPAWLPLFSFGFLFRAAALATLPRVVFYAASPPSLVVSRCFRLFSFCFSFVFWLRLCVRMVTLPRAVCLYPSSLHFVVELCGFGSNLNPDPR